MLMFNIQHQCSTINEIAAQSRQHPVRWIATRIVPNVSQSVGMQARPLCDDRKPSVLKLVSDLL
jgi:hypothetical protein